MLTVKKPMPGSLLIFRFRGTTLNYEELLIALELFPLFLLFPCFLCFLFSLYPLVPLFFSSLFLFFLFFPFFSLFFLLPSWASSLKLRMDRRQGQHGNGAFAAVCRAASS